MVAWALKLDATTRRQDRMMLYVPNPDREQVKALVTKPDNMDSTLGARMLDGEDQVT